MSNVIKFSSYISLDDKKVVDVAAKSLGTSLEEAAEDSAAEDQAKQLNEAAIMKEQILSDAEQYAEEQIRAAMEEAERLKEQAESDINLWWEQRRSDDQQHLENAKQTGYEQGFTQGLTQAEAQVMAQYQEMLDQSRAVLEQSYQLKQQIVQEAEPFLIELSCAIAEKIVVQQLTIEPQWTIDLIKRILERRKEKGIITLCVSPKQFMYIQDARDELVLHVDSQAELQIIPDSSVTDMGCVVRSSFGSIDARIDTQLQEIKHALRQIALRNEGV